MQEHLVAKQRPSLWPRPQSNKEPRSFDIFYHVPIGGYAQFLARADFPKGAERFRIAVNAAKKQARGG
jgi:hypothetical protein